MNPVSGGSPPRESRIKQASALRAGDLVQAEVRVIVLVEFTLSSVRKAAVVIVIYVIRASKVIWGAIWATKIIHPRCATEEYARTFRSWVWLRPPHPPTRVEQTAKAVSKWGWAFSATCKIRAKGASFCQVERINPVVSVIPWSTSGSQKCVGAKPIFSASAIIAMVQAMGWERWEISHCPSIHALVVLANRSMAAAVACVRKYLVVASMARGWCWRAIRGMMARVLISRPIHARSQWELAKVRVVPSPRLNKRMAIT